MPLPTEGEIAAALLDRLRSVTSHFFTQIDVSTRQLPRFRISAPTDTIPRLGTGVPIPTKPPR